MAFIHAKSLPGFLPLLLLLLLCVGSQCGAFSTMAPAPVALSDFHGIVQEPTDDGTGPIHKLLSRDQTWNSIAVSKDFIDMTNQAQHGRRGVSFKIPTGVNPLYFMCGLARGPQASLAQKIGYTDIEFASHISGINFYVLETGAGKGNFGQVAGGDIVKVALNSEAKIEYLVNDQIRYTSRQIPSNTLFVKVAAYYPGIILEKLQWTFDSLRNSTSTSIQSQSSVEEINEMHKEVQRLEAQNERLETQNERLEMQNGRLEAKNERLETQNERLEMQNGRLEAKNERLEEKNERLEAKVERLESKIERLEANYDRLEIFLDKMTVQSNASVKDDL